MAVQMKVSTLGNDVAQAPAFTVVDELVVTEPSQVLLNLVPEDIATMRREGDDLIIERANGETLEIVDFYAHSNGQNQSELFLTGADDQFIPLELTTLSDGSIAYTPYFPPGELSGFELAESVAAAGGGSFGGVGFVPLALGGAALAGIAAVAGGSSSGSSPPGDAPEDGEGGPVDPGAPDDPDDGEEPGGEMPLDAPTLALEMDAGSVAGHTADGTVLVGSLTQGLGWEYSLDGGDSWQEGAGDSFELPEGVYPSGQVVARQVDGDGNVSETANLGAVTIDQTLPTVPSLTLQSDTGDVEGVTADGTLIVGGLESGASWEFSLDGGSTWQQGAGDRFVLPEGDYGQGQVQARQTDSAGNISEVTAFDAIRVDLTIDAPLDPELPDIPTLVLANDTGSQDDITRDGTVQVGNLEEGGNWEYSLDGGTTWLSGDGNAFLLPEGDYPSGQVLARQSDIAGNTSGTSTLESVTVDTTAPVNPVLTLANDTGLEDGITSDGTVLVSNLEEGALWEYSIDGGATWLSGADARFVLAEGEYAAGQVQARQVDAAGNLSDINELGLITVDLDADLPAEPDSPATPTLELANDTGAIDGISMDGTVLVDNLEEGASWEYSLDGGSTWLVGEGASFVLPEDSYELGSVQVRQSDTEGNNSQVGTLAAVIIDNNAPPAPTASLANNTGDVEGVTSDGTVEVGNLEQGAAWEYSLDGGGTWKQGIGEQFVLPEGEYVAGQVQVRQTDAAGNVSEVTEFGAVTVDLIIDDPDDPELPDAPTLMLTNDTGVTDGISNDGTVVVGNLEEGATWEYSLDGGATWLAGVDDGFVVPEGDYVAGQVLARQTDIDGNTSGTRTLGSISIDLTAPEMPTVSLANDTGEQDGITADGTIVVGNLDPEAFWEYTLDGGTTWLQGVGDRFILEEAVYADGDVQVRQSDGAGNLSPVASLGPVTIDLTGLAAPTVTLANDNGDVPGVTNDATVSVGNLEENAAWEYSLDGGATWEEGVGDSFELPEAVYADGDVQVRQSDGAGNLSPVASLGPVTIDQTSPGGEGGNDAPVLAIPLLTDGFIDSEGAEAAISTVVGLTDGTQLGDTVTVQLTIAGNAIDTSYLVTADDLEVGSATIPLAGDYPDGSYTAIAFISDQAGNVSADSNQLAFTLDTTAPGANTTTITVDDLTADNVINIEESAGQVTISGTVNGEYQPGDAVTITINDEVYDTTLGDDGTWSVAVLGTLLAEADPQQISVDVLATDEAGNVGNIEFTHDYAIDLVTSEITLDPIDAINSDDVNDDLIITGTAEGVIEGATVTVDIEGTSFTGSVANGVWSATIPAAFLAGLEDGTLQVTAAVADQAGNIDQTESVEVLLDTQSPSVDITISDALLAAGQTATVTFAFSEAIDGFSISDINAVGGTLSNLATDDNLTWTATFTPGDVSTEASIDIAAGAYLDGAGNPGQATALEGIVVDVDAPTLVAISAAVEGDLSSLETTEITIEFNEEITGLTGDEFVVIGGALSGLSSADGITWTATFTPNGMTSAASITLPDATYTDIAGNQGAGGELADLPVEILQPVLVIEAASNGFINDEEALGSEAQVGFEGLGVTAGQTITLTLLATADGDDGVTAGDTITTITYSVTADDVANGFAVFDLVVDPEFANQPASAQVAIEAITTASEAVEFVLDTVPPGQAVDEGAAVQGNGIVLDSLLNPGDALRLRIGNDQDTVQVLDTDEYPGLLYENAEGQTVLDLFALTVNLEELLGNDLGSLLDLRALALQLSTYDAAGNESDIVTLDDINLLGPLVTVVDFAGSLVGVSDPGATLDVDVTLAGTTQTVTLEADDNGEFSLDLLADPRFSFSLDDLLSASVSIIATDAQGNRSYAPVEVSLDELLPAPLSTADLSFVTDIVFGSEGVVSALSGLVLPQGSALDATLQVGGLGSVSVPVSSTSEGEVSLDLNAALLSAVSSFDLLSGISGLFNGRGLGLTLEYTTSDGVVTTTSVELLGGSLAQLTFGDVNQIIINGTEAADLLIVEADQSVAAGAGDDLIVLRSSEFASIDGGTGLNTLLLEGGLTLGIESFERISNIQRINLGDSASSVEINADIAAALAGEQGSLEMIGEATDSLVITGAVAVGEPTSIDGALFQAFTLDGVSLLVSDSVDVQLVPSINETAGYLISGGAEANADILIEAEGTTYTTTANGSGEWHLLLDTPLAAGSQVSVVVDGQAGNTVSVPESQVAPAGLQIRVPPLVGLLASFLEGSAVGAEEIQLDVFQDDLFTSLRSTTIDVGSDGSFSTSTTVLTDLLNNVTGLLVGNQGVNVGFTAIAPDGSRSTTEVVEFGDSESIFQDPAGALTGLLGDIVGGITGTTEALPTTESFYAGDDSADFVQGSGLAQTITTEEGNDIVISGGGADTIDTGAGDDIISVGSNAFASIDGGDGFDVVMLDSGFDLNMEDASTGGMANIEQVDLGQQNGGNTLTLTGDQLIELTDESNVLQITGDSQDSAELSGAGWVNTEQQQILDGVVFNEYSYQGASLLVEDGITTNLEVA